MNRLAEIRMVVTCQGVFTDEGKIVVLQPNRLDPMREVHGEGEPVTITFDDDPEPPLSAAFRLFHVYRDQLSNKRGDADKEYTKAWLKWKYGVCIPYVEGFKPPVEWQRGRFLEVEGRIYYAKSTTVYTVEELNVLIEGTLSELGVAA